jgi:hypothetical protein
MRVLQVHHALLNPAKVCRAVSITELSRNLHLYDAPFNIPAGEAAQIYELKRVFRL